ncbi:PspC domain-containing protein [uncultured Psychroserpens sp.]|uniref:PspC domain-containing protein n=1 Tax=uncultured Psychroserpens sp. TaxID=255436 RepID=UPI00261DCCC3|nr:PspC domain-containing protein [uncultured Psychroserpens sp.]
MNKTVNINLAGIFFHIDEDAYLKLQRYLEAIKRSFTDSQGRSEIISDIEARIAELFNERVQNEKQVIRIKEVDEVISIMGQPEDYLVDDEIFEDEPKTSYQKTYRTSKKLYRDTDNSYVGGVSSGLAHYFGIDAIWIRLIWILLIFGAGTGVLLYILLWILVPEATTTSEKLTMTGEPVNISNIEKKIKDGFDSVSQTVSDTVKNVDLPKQGKKIKSSSKHFFDTIGDIFMFFLKVIAKFIGIILIIVGAATLISLIISLFSVGVADIIHIPGMDFVDAANAANMPMWLMSLLLLFVFGIPFFFLAYLGLKILVNNLNSIGKVAKFTLLGLWLISFIGLIVSGVNLASEYSEDATYTKREELNIKANDTIYLNMAHNRLYSKYFGRYSNNGFKPVYDENDTKIIYSTDVRLIVRSTKDSMASLSIDKYSRGRNYKAAKTRAENIDFGYELNGNRLNLNGYLTTPFENKFRDQEVEVTLYLPEGTILFAEDNTYSYHRNSSYYNDILVNGMEEQYLLIKQNGVKCLDCPIDEEFKVKIDVKDEDTGLKLDDDGLEIKTNDSSLKIDDDGLKAESENVKVNIDEDGVEIISDDN